QLARQDQAHSGLNLARRDGGLLNIAAQPGGLSSNFLEDVIIKAVHNRHGLGADAGIGMHLLQHLENIELKGLALGNLSLLLGLFRGFRASRSGLVGCPLGSRLLLLLGLFFLI
ncbi:hypothetical protein Vretimale_12811, partial [Volvox reticuliferus]